jgi:predicted DNA-binding transcriptional regulator AlpA
MNINVFKNQHTEVLFMNLNNYGAEPAPSEVLTAKQTAQYLSIGNGTLAKLDIPKVKIRRRTVYRKADIEAWLEANVERRVTA